MNLTDRAAHRTQNIYIRRYDRIVPPSKFRTWKDIHTARLYHYEKFCPAWLTTTLRDKKIHCSDPTKLNDPWDCKPWVHRKADATGPAMDWEAMSVGVQKEIAKRRIYCLTPDPLSTLMWSHYGGDHRGICLEFHLSNLLFNKVMGVCYEDEYPSILPEEMFARVRDVILTKADCWKYEEEFRLIGSPDLPDDDPQRLHGEFLKLPDLALMSVIVGCNGDYDAVKTIVDQHAPGLRVSQIVRLPSEYKLTVALAPEEYRKQRMLSWPRHPDLISQLDRGHAASGSSPVISTG